MVELERVIEWNVEWNVEVLPERVSVEILWYGLTEIDQLCTIQIEYLER